MATALGPNAELIGRPGSRWQLQTPALILDLEPFEANIVAMAAWAEAGGVDLRPHGKSHKSPEIARRQIAAGAIGICCANVHEAEAMSAAGLPGILITTPTAPVKAARIAAIAKASPDLACVVDHPAQIEALDAAAMATGASIRVLVDLDTGLGRTGVTETADAVALARQIADCDGLTYVGVQGYTGHLQHVEDLGQRRARLGEPTIRLESFVLALKDANLNPGIVTGGGTGTHRLDQRLGLIGEMQVGSYVFMDVQYNAVAIDDGDARPYRTSLYVQTSVINVNHPGYAVTDAGLKSFATDGPAPVIARGAPADATYRYKGDEHGAIYFANDGDAMELGARIECVTPHCDPNVNLYDVYHVVRGDDLVDIWPVAGRGNP